MSENVNPERTKRTALIIASLSSFMTPFMGSSISIALPSIEKEFGINAVLLSWIATSYLLASAISMVPFGRLADIFGRKRTFAWGISIFTLSSLLCALSFSAPVLILFRALQGVGSAMIFATGIAILTSVYPARQRGRVLGVNVAAVYLGLSLGPFLGGLLTQHLGWRSVFYANIPFGVVIIGLVLWRLDGEWAEARGETFDWPGSLLYGLALLGIMIGISLVPSPKTLWLILFGMAGGWSFLRWESRVKSPVFNLSLFGANRVFAFSCLAALINYSATFAVTFLLSLYLQHIKALSPQYAGLVLVCQPLVMALFSPFAGRLSDKVEPRIVASVGMALTTSGLFLLIFLDERTTLTFLMGSQILLGFGFALFSSPNTNAIMGSVEKRFYGIASGAVGTMRLLGMMVSMGIATMTFALWIGRIRIERVPHPIFIQTIRIAFILFSILCLCGIFASLVRGHLHATPPEGPRPEEGRKTA